MRKGVNWIRLWTKRWNDLYEETLHQKKKKKIIQRLTHVILENHMRLKSELYAKEQEEITKKIVTILNLSHKSVYTLYELDKNTVVQ